MLFERIWIGIRIPNSDPDQEGHRIRISYGSGSKTLFTSALFHLGLRLLPSVVLFPGASVPLAIPWRLQQQHPLPRVPGAHPRCECRGGSGCRRRSHFAHAAHPRAAGSDAAPGPRGSLIRQYCSNRPGRPAVDSPAAAAATTAAAAANFLWWRGCVVAYAFSC